MLGTHQRTNARVRDRHRYQKNTEHLSSYPGGSRKKTLEGILKNEKRMVEEGLPAGKELVHGAEEAPVSSRAPFPCTPGMYGEAGHTRARLGRQYKVTRDL